MKPAGPQSHLPLPEAERIAYLIAGFLQQKLTEAEHDELDTWVVASEDNTKLFEELTDEDNIEAGLAWHRETERNKAAALAKIKEELGLRKKPSVLTLLWPYLVAACLITAVAVLVPLFRNNKELSPTTDNHGTIATNATNHRQAVLQLSNGRTLILDSAGSGLLATDGGATISRGANGELIYSGDDSVTRYNVVSTPRGGQFPLVLGDGSQVWLNAESSLKYPAYFGSGEREVVLSGEAFFDVAKNPDKPFKVRFAKADGGEGEVVVLGTRFNVNAYGDEGVLTVTLEEGKVRVRHNKDSALLKPGQQARIGKELSVLSADMGKETGWKEGQFVFKDATIRSIGKQLERWYDVEAVYGGAIDFHFNATIARTEPLDHLLDILAATKRVRFTLDGKKLNIKP